MMIRLCCNECEYEVGGHPQYYGLFKQLLGLHRTQKHKGRKGNYNQSIKTKHSRLGIV